MSRGVGREYRSLVHLVARGDRSVAERLLDWVAGLPTVAVYAVLALLSSVENVFPPVPADVAVVFGAFLSRRGVVSAPLLGVVCWLANTASSAGMYFLARARGKRFFASGWPSKLLPPDAIKRWSACTASTACWGSS